MFPLVFMGLLTGWSVVVILSDLLDFKDKFRHYYDHLWYSMAILTCLFFVADSNTSQVAQEFQQGNQLARQASAYLLQQVRDYDLQCQKDPSYWHCFMRLGSRCAAEVKRLRNGR